MAKIIVMPKLGLTMSEGVVSKWLKKEGDPVVEGEALFEVETDKLTNTIDAPASGILRKIILGEGESSKITEPIGIIADEDEDISGVLDMEIAPEEEEKEVGEEMEGSENKTLHREDSGDYILAYPYAKKLASDQSIDLSRVVASNSDGIIRSIDLDNIEIDRVKSSPVARKMMDEHGIDPSEIEASGRIMKDDVLARLRAGQEAGSDKLEEIERVKMSGMRRVISERMHESWITSPRVNYNVEVNMENLIALRSSLKPEFEKDDLKISYNHLFMKMVAHALMEHPYLNASIDGDEIVFHRYVNMGLAVDVGDGLLVPNVKGIDRMNLKEISYITEELIGNALDNQLSPDDLQGGTFTISNLGMFGIDSFSPIINQPESAILGLNRIIDKPVVLDGEICIRPMMNISLTADHRLVDGAVAAKFLSSLVKLIENPYLLLI